MSDSDSQPVAFTELPLDPALVEAVTALGFEHATPIQAAAIPVMAEGRDLIGRARTGSGKTAAFGLPLLHAVREGGTPPKALVLAPTRELALQVTDALNSFATGLRLSITTVYGGAPYGPQIHGLRKATVVVGTPGRLLDHLDRGNLDLSQIRHVVLDEADEMLRMGFIDDVERLLSEMPSDRQIALFSATMPPEIRKVADRHLQDPVEVQVEGRAMTVDHIEQQWMRVPARHKLEALGRVLRGTPHEAVLVFARTRASCADVADALTKMGISVDALHGDLSQSARERVLRRLRAGRIDVVIATDVAARGIDVDHVTHVINYDLPIDTETYVHRIGRTGRVGRKGVAISFATPKEKQRIRRISRQLGARIDQVDVPSDATIARGAQARFLAQLTEAAEAPDADATGWLAEAIAQSELTVEQVAEAAVRLLAAQQHVPLATPNEDAPPEWVRPMRRPEDFASRSTDGDREDTNEVQLFLPVGRQRHVRPGDIVGALAHEAGIDGGRIGKVVILDRKTFVGVPKSVADTVLNLDHVQIRGREVPVTLARPGSNRPPRRRERDGQGPPRRRRDDRGPKDRSRRPPRSWNADPR
ncbi:MAG: DEAD/DEAH box helicase [Myxococcota bacterium]